jgi:hypothetical protein
MIRLLEHDPTNLPASQPTVMSYRRTTPPVRHRWTVGEVMLGLLVGLLTILMGLPVFLLWAYRHLHTDGWTLPLALFGGAVVAMLLGAFSVRRPHQLPGLFPGLLAGVVGGMVIIGTVMFYVFHQ